MHFPADPAAGFEQVARHASPGGDRLSEETDAAIVVVSEETGAVSYAYKGHLTRAVTLEELRSFLTSVLVQPAKSHDVRRMAARAVRRAAQARPGGHHRDTSRVRRPNQPANKLSKPCATGSSKDLGWKLFSAGSGGGHLADRPQDSRGTGCRRPTAAARASTRSTYEQPARARRFRRPPTCANFTSAPSAVAVTVSGPPDIMAALQADQVHARRGPDRHRSRARPAPAGGQSRRRRA